MTNINPRPIINPEELFQFTQDVEAEYKKDLAIHDIIDQISGRRSNLN